MPRLMRLTHTSLSFPPPRAHSHSCHKAYMANPYTSSSLSHTRIHTSLPLSLANELLAKAPRAHAKAFSPVSLRGGGKAVKRTCGGKVLSAIWPAERITMLKCGLRPEALCVYSAKKTTQSETISQKDSMNYCFMKTSVIICLGGGVWMIILLGAPSFSFACRLENSDVWQQEALPKHIYFVVAELLSIVRHSTWN